MDIVEKAIIAKFKKISELHPETGRWPIDFDEEEQREEREIMSLVVKETLSTCKRSLQLADCLTDFLMWTDSLAITGSVSPEAWVLLDKIRHKAEKTLLRGELDHARKAIGKKE